MTYSPYAISTNLAFDVTNGGVVDLAAASILPQVNWNAQAQAGRIKGWTNVTLKGVAKSGAKTLLLPFVNIENTLNIESGTVKLNPSGLNRGEMRGFGTTNFGKPDTFENGAFKYIMPSEKVDTLVEAYKQGCLPDGGLNGEEVSENSMAVAYTGYMWNHNKTNEVWSFRTAFDDNAVIRVTNVVQLSGNNHQGPVNVLMKPGPNKVDILLRNAWGGGGAGYAGNGWIDNFGIAYDPLGRGSNDPAMYKKVNNVETEDGSLWTYAGPDPENPYRGVNELVVWEDGIFDMNRFYCSFNNIKSEGGVLTNGHLIVEKRITFPASANKISLLGDESTIEFKDGAEIVFEDESALSKSRVYVAVESPTAILGNNPAVISASGIWKVRKDDGDRRLVIYYNSGMCIIIR